MYRVELKAVYNGFPEMGQIPFLMYRVELKVQKHRGRAFYSEGS